MPVARRGDPSTSWAAAESIPDQVVRLTQAIVWRELLEHGPMTDEELVDRLRGAMSPSGARTRRRELADLGLVFDTGQRVTLRSRRRAIVWSARALAPIALDFGL